MDKPMSPGERWAEVRADGRLIRYRSLGAGRPVIVLGLSDRDAPSGLAWSTWIEGLAAGFRVLVPEARDVGGDVTGWLGCFLEGLGSTGVGVVAAGSFREAAMDLATLEPDRIARIVLLDEGPLGLGRADLLVLRLSSDAKDPASRLSRTVAFLGGEAAAPPA